MQAYMAKELILEKLARHYDGSKEIHQEFQIPAC
jgi:hypothetical protein